MKLRPQPKLPRRGSGSRRPARGATARARPGRGRGARRPGVSLRDRIGPRLPSIRRVLAGLGAVAATGALLALLNGPWLRVSHTEASGSHFTNTAALAELLDAERGASLLAVDTDGLAARIERLPSVGEATVAVSLSGSVVATIVEREPAFVWETRSARFVGAADGTLFAGGRNQDDMDPALEGLPRIQDRRFVARVVKVGDVIDESIRRVALRLAAIDPAELGSDARRLSITLDDEVGFRIGSEDPAWQIALGVYGLDPSETAAEADARLERQITAVRTLFATRPEAEIGWVDVRNPGKVYFRAKG